MRIADLVPHIVPAWHTAEIRLPKDEYHSHRLGEVGLGRRYAVTIETIAKCSITGMPFQRVEECVLALSQLFGREPHRLESYRRSRIAAQRRADLARSLKSALMVPRLAGANAVWLIERREQLSDGDAERSSDSVDDVQRWRLPPPFQITQIRRVYAGAIGEFLLGQLGFIPQIADPGSEGRAEVPHDCDIVRTEELT
jgi:hypothetical protein